MNTNESTATVEQVPKMRYYRPEVKKLRVLLLALGILYTFGLHPKAGDIGQLLLNFSIPALYITSGFLVLRESQNMEKRILRAIKRTGICFVVLCAAYFGLSLLVQPEVTLAAISSKWFWFNFVVLNVCTLPIGSTIWFVQAMLYAYIIIYVLCKLKLLRFDIYIALLCLAVTVLTGELASVIGFHFLGLDHLSGNFFTRALPYLLIGCFLHRKMPAFFRLKPKHYCFIIAGGAALLIAEYLLLNLSGNKVYLGHLLGAGLVAVGVTLWVFSVGGMKVRSKLLASCSRIELMIPYYVCSPIFYFLTMAFARSAPQAMYDASGFIGILTVVCSYLLLYAYALLRRKVRIIRHRARKKKARKNEKTALSDMGSDEK